MPPDSGRGLRARHIRTVLLAGLGLAFVLVWRTGWPAIQANLASIGWWFFGLTALYLLAEIAFVQLLWVLPGLAFLARPPAVKAADESIVGGSELAGSGRVR